MTTIDHKGITWFCALAMLGSLSIGAVVWNLDGGLANPVARYILMGGMCTPAIAALLTSFFIVKDQNKKSLFGFRLGHQWPRHWAIHWFIWPLLSLGALVIGDLLGLYPLDLEFSGFAAMVTTPMPHGSPNPLSEMPVELLAGLSLLACLFAPIVNAPVMFGEELGWRGYLLPKLMPLGSTWAILISGLIWGIWHAPFILLGHNYPQHPVLGVFLMVGFCVIVGTLIGWSRIKTGSLWPAIIAHGALNGSAGVIVLFAEKDVPFDTALVGIVGITGWILPLLAIGAIIKWSNFSAPDDADAKI